MTTHDVHRAMGENLFNSIHRHAQLQPSTNLGNSPAFRSMAASDLITLLPNTPTSNHHHRQQASNRHRPSSDILQVNQATANIGSGGNSSAEDAIDRWFENIQRYEQMLEEVAAASLDQDFKDELHHVNQWFRCRSDAERTAALYTVVQNASQIQVRFLITVLQQLANQDPLGELLSPAGQEKAPTAAGPAPVTVAGSVVSTESQYEMRKRQMYPPSRRATRSNLCNRLTSALSEPDDLRRRRDVLIPRSLGLSQQGLLYEKALAARAQIQAANNSARSSSAAATAAATSNPSSVGYPPRMKTSISTSDASSTPTSRSTLFSNDWPFPLVRGANTTKAEKPLVGRIGDRASVASSADENWSFGSLSSKKKKDLDSSWPRKNDTIKEEQEYPPSYNTRSTTSALMANSMTALEQAQARLRREYQRSNHTNNNKNNVNNNNNNNREDKTPSPEYQHKQQQQQQQEAPATVIYPAIPATPTTPAITTTTTGTKPTPTVAIPQITTTTTTNNISQQQQQQQQPLPPGLTPVERKEKQFGQFLSPPQENDAGNEYLSDQSDASNVSNKEQPLTGAARRRKRSSAARALKDKIAAETVDFELMKDVQNWMRSLRLHKYSHAFEGMQWQQVIRMSDEEMEKAGVSTVGARRKLLKVFENVMRHCEEHGIEY